MFLNEHVVILMTERVAKVNPGGAKKTAHFTKYGVRLSVV